MEGDQYLRYLQQLLVDNHIAHLDEHAFAEREQSQKEKEKEQPQSN